MYSDHIKALLLMLGKDAAPYIEVRYSRKVKVVDGEVVTKDENGKPLKYPPSLVSAYSNVDKAVDAIVELGSDRNIYFVVANGKAAGNKHASNMDSVSAFWIDVDIREGKGYASFADADAGVKRMCASLNLPTPVTAFSGGGIHVYWILKTPVSPTYWKQVATKLLAALKQHGDASILDDVARVTDVSSIMRVIGTYNATRQSDSYFLSAEVFSITAQAFEAALDTYLAKSNVATSLPAPPPVNALAPMVGTSPYASASRIDTMPAEKPTYAQLLSNCAVLRDMAKYPQISEVAWKYSLTLITQTVDWEKAVHEFSSPYDGYNYDETQAKSEACFSLGKPTLCATYASSSDRDYMCVGCHNKTQKGVSPLKGATKVKIVDAMAGESTLDLIERSALVYRIVAEHVSGKSVDPSVSLPKQLVINPETQQPDSSIVLPDPPKMWIYGTTGFPKSGLYRLDIPDGINEPITTDLIWVSASRIDTISSPRVVSYEIFHHDRLGVHSYVVDAKTLEPRTLASWLLSRGLTASSRVGVDLISYIGECCEIARSSLSPPRYIVDSYGWYMLGNKQVFATPTAVITADGRELSVLVRDANQSDFAHAIGTNGIIEPSVQEWGRGFRKLYGDQPHAAWAILASLASALFFPCRASSQGLNAMVVFFSGQTGSGKTLLAKSCQSVWQHDDMVAGNSTVTAIQKLCVRARHLPFVIDDLTTSPTAIDSLRQLLLFFPQGKEKQRSSASNILTEAGTWANTIFISTNLDINTVMEACDVGGGARARMIDMNIPYIDTGISDRDRADAVSTMLAHHGTLGNALVARMINKKQQEITALVNDADVELIEILKRRGVSHSEIQERRFRRRMVAMCIAVADIMEDILPFDASIPIAWGIDSLVEGEFSVLSHSSIGVETKARAAKFLRAYIMRRTATTYAEVVGVDRQAELAAQSLTENEARLRSGLYSPAYRSETRMTSDGQAVQYRTFYEKCSADNKHLRASRVSISVVKVVNNTTHLVEGYYIPSEVLNSDDYNKTYGKSAQQLADALGETVDKLPRLRTVKLDESIVGSGTTIGIPVLWVSQSELD